VIRLAPFWLLILVGSATAHEADSDAAAAAAWSFELPVLLPLAISAALYACGTVRLWRRAGVARGVGMRDIAAFAAGWIVLSAALVSPLHDLSGRLFTAHMIEHELLMLVAAPLFILAQPLGALVWGLPKAWRAAAARPARARPVAAAWAWASRPAIATLLHGLAIWAWHAPLLFRAALAHEWVHWLQHASFFGTALLFWWALARSVAMRRLQGIGHLFVTSVHTSLLGALLVFSPRPWFEFQSPAAAHWGLTILEDQQLAGLIMWIPGGSIYAGAALALVAALLLRGPDSPRLAADGGGVK
jgi:cytochrome c oxidase assembly factor CtaG